MPRRALLQALSTAALALTIAAPLHAAPPAGFADEVERLRQEVGVPGMAISIVEDGQVTFDQGFGVRKLGGTERVDAQTIFPNGSTGKAFTTAALALLVDEGKIGWDDPVIQHMPWFAMYDPWVTREMTVRDLLVHRSGLGLGEGDLLLVPRSDRTRRESVERLRYLKPATSFRSAYAYDNVLYMAAGQLIEEVSGQTWEAFVRDRILTPLQMDESRTDVTRFDVANRAFPHARIGGAFRGLGDLTVLDERDELGRNGAPAGGMTVSASDMADWMRVQLASGRMPDGGRLFSEAAAREMWTPVVLQPIGTLPQPIRAAQPMFDTYALGWDVQDYKGAKIVSHGGAVFGFLSLVVLVPEKNVGFTILINSEDGEILRGLQYTLLDHYLDKPTQDWPAAFRAVKAERLKAALAVVQQTQASPAKVGPSLPLSRYAGEYVDPWYGPVAIREEGGGLRIDFTRTPRLAGRLEHWQYDTFRTVFDDPSAEPAYVTFALDADGAIDRVTMKPVSPIADFSWDYQDLKLTPVVTGERK